MPNCPMNHLNISRIAVCVTSVVYNCPKLLELSDNACIKKCLQQYVTFYLT